MASSAGTVKPERSSRPSPSFPLTGVYDPKAFVPHAALLRQACAHCGRFPTAASRRSRGRVSVPVWPAILSDRLPIIALVGRYPANELMGRGPVCGRERCRPPLLLGASAPRSVPGISGPFEPLSQTPRWVTHVLLTRPPLTASVALGGPLDLHVLGTPPAFVLSQDQTLQFASRRSSVPAGTSRPRRKPGHAHLLGEPVAYSAVKEPRRLL